MSSRLELPSATHHTWLAKRFADKKFADARFVVIENGDHRREFLAHKMVLASVSDVFEAMFYGSFPEEDPIKIEETTVGAFESMLEYIYTGTVTVDSVSVFALLYLAKKYLLGRLASLLLKHLQSTVDESNVTELVLHGQDHLDDAPEKFWRSVEAYAQTLLESETFLLLKKSTVIELVGRNLEAQETLVFNRVVAWAETECERNDLLPTPENVRTQLDGVIRLVRFPLMSSKEFTLGPFKSELLTQEEKLDLFPWFTAEEEPSMFSTSERVHAQYVCDRFTEVSKSWNYRGSADAITFKVNRDVVIMGIGIYGASNATSAKYKVNVGLRLAACDTELAEVDTRVTVEGSEEMATVKFSKPVKVSAHVDHIIVAKIDGPNNRHGGNGSASVAVKTGKGDVTFCFGPTDLSTNSTSVTRGQIPRIVFKLL